MTPVELSRTVLCAVRRAVDEGELSVAVPRRAVVAPPGPGGCGDYATNIALQLARPAGLPPLRVAEILQRHLVRTDGVAEVVVTGPGFINISLQGAAGSAAANLTREILRAGAAYGHGDALAGQVVEVRIPYDVRAEVVADALVRIVGSQGGRVEVAHGEPVNLRPVPAPDDPALLGPDAARWALLHPAAHDRPRITADHLVQRESNPLFRVRYAHARTRALSRNAADLGFTPEPGHVEAEVEVEVETQAEARAEARAEAQAEVDACPKDDISRLLAVLADHPRVLARAAAHRTPDSLARQLVTVADAVLAVLPSVLPRGDEKPSAAHRARLALAEAAGAVLAGGLSLLGIDAPLHL
ncbi:ArgS-related anticodon-binding protein NrtL [Streptomyces sp. NBC_00078]|uniref:ArgS-related anticodon-binding protein NrtL n=1 Tax=unclassified Streptomyces TaxID=2593676 RepID=UPI00224EF097|nr:DALR anticodon-binding domain-containing protein [Streptomyces sp. NBC_00078]MCX5423688.1 DALR anticodon-binding domain-containing protein [Streptomyces sp. NBC_00078]